MPWTVTTPTPIPDPSTAGWVNAVVPVGQSGVLAWGLDYDPDGDQPPSWSRIGWGMCGIRVDNVQLTTPTFTLPGVTQNGNSLPVVLDWSLLLRDPAIAPRVQDYRVYIHVVPYAPPGSLRLWRLT